jgi:hypothetical protein
LKRAAIFAALLLAACGGNAAREELPPPQLPDRAGVDPLVAARSEGVEFRAVADGVVVDIFREHHIRLITTATGEQLIFPKTEPRFPRWNGSIYETISGTRSLGIEIRNHQPCERADRDLYPITVTIVLDGRQIPACGRAF